MSELTERAESYLSQNAAESGADILIRELIEEAIKSKAAVAYLIDHIEYSDSYGVDGSDFQVCHLCQGGGAPGIRLVHDRDCPVQKCGPIAAEWWEELQAERAEANAPAQGAPTSAELFCDWLQGYFVGLAGKDELTASEANTIRNALNSLTASAVSHPTENIEPGA